MWLVYLTLISEKKSSAVASKLSKIFISYFASVLKRVAKVGVLLFSPNKFQNIFQNLWLITICKSRTKFKKLKWTAKLESLFLSANFLSLFYSQHQYKITKELDVFDWGCKGRDYFNTSKSFSSFSTLFLLLSSESIFLRTTAFLKLVAKIGRFWLLPNIF